MTKSDKDVLRKLSKDQLIYLIEQQDRSLCIIGEICIDESKWHIDSKEAIRQIRKCIYHIPSLYDVTELKGFIDMEMGKISVKKYRKILGLD